MKDLNTVFIELNIDAEASVFERLERGRGKRLGELLESAPGARWVILGDPGAGKSTIARHEAWVRASAQGILPVYASLPALAVSRLHPFRLAEEDACAGKGDGKCKGLYSLLEARADEGNVWLLLDGLDDADHRPWVGRQLCQWASDLPRVTIAVFSRPIGYQRPDAQFDRQARIMALDATAQQALLLKWLGTGEQPSLVWKSVQARAGLQEACKKRRSCSRCWRTSSNTATAKCPATDGSFTTRR